MGVPAPHQATQPGGSGGLSGHMYWPMGHGVNLTSGTYERSSQHWWRTVGSFNNVGLYVNVNNDIDTTLIRTMFNASLGPAIGASGAHGTTQIVVPASTTGYFTSTTEDPMPSGQSRYVVMRRTRNGAVGINGFLATSLQYTFTSDTADERCYRMVLNAAGNMDNYPIFYAGVAATSQSGAEQGVFTSDLGFQMYAPPSGALFRNGCFKTWTNSNEGDINVTLRVNGADTALVVFIPASASGRFENLDDEVTVVEGDLFNWKVVHDDDTGLYIHESYCVDMVTPDFYAGGTRNGAGIVINQTDDNYCSPSGNHENNQSAEGSEISWRAASNEAWRGIVVAIPTNGMLAGNVYWRTVINDVDGDQEVTVPFGQTGIFISAGATEDVFQIDDELLIRRVSIGGSAESLTYHTHSLFGGPVTVESDPSASDPSASDPTPSDPPVEAEECVAAPPTVECYAAAVAKAGCVATHAAPEAGCAEAFDSTTLSVRLNG